MGKPAGGGNLFTTSESCQVMLCEMGDKIMEEELRPEKYELWSPASAPKFSSK